MKTNKKQGAQLPWKMVDLVQVVQTGSGDGASPPYAVLHGAPYRLAPLLSGKLDVLAAIILKSCELPLQEWTAQVRLWMLPQFYLPSGIEVVVLNSLLETVYEQLVPSTSKDSDALYLGHSIKHGLLLQLMSPARRHGGDPVSHTSSHRHNRAETYYMLHGSAEVWLKYENGAVNRVMLGTENGKREMLAVPPQVAHPVVAITAESLMLIVTSPEAVADQVSGNLNNHLNSQPFRGCYASELQTLFPCTQRVLRA